MDAAPHRNDIDPESLAWARASSPWPESLDRLVCLSRQHFGWFTKHLPRSFEYPWVLSRIGNAPGKRILDIGAGVSPVPLRLAALGAHVLTVDHSTELRRMGQNEEQWNEWGYLDYSACDRRIESRLRTLLELPLPDGSLDVVYSISVIEHMPADVRRGLIRRVGRWLKPDGLLLLTVDLAPGSMHLWNRCAGQVVESQEEHGDLSTLECELEAAGFSLRDREILRDLPETPVDCALLSLVHDATSLPMPGVVVKERTLAAIGPAPSDGPGQVALGCTADNDPKYLSQAVRLIESLRWFGGQLADAPFFVCLVDPIDAGYQHRLEQLGASVRVVPRVSTRHGHSNKLRLLETPELRQFDTVVLLDCDTVIMQDPLAWLDGRNFQARMADMPTMPHATFARVFDHFGLPLPEPTYRCNPGGYPTIWYCNAGVLIFPRPMLDTLAVAWRHWNDRLLERLDLLGNHQFFCDQASLSLAFATHPVPFAELPLAMNYPLHLSIAEAPGLSEPCDPVIVHYHHCVDRLGNLEAAPDSMAQLRVQEYNRRRAGLPQAAYSATSSC